MKDGTGTTGTYPGAVENLTRRKRSLMQKLVMCRLLKRHKYYVIKRYSKTTRKLGCRNCPKMWGMHDVAKTLVEWDGELEEFHEDT